MRERPELIMPDGYIKNNPNTIKRIQKDVQEENSFHYLFIGGVGCGKTHLAKIVEHSIYNSFNEPATHINVRRFYEKHLQLMNGDYKDKWEAIAKHRRKLSHSTFVVLDDLGDEKPNTESAHDYFAGIIEDRYDYIMKYAKQKGYLRTIITTNLKGKDLLSTYGSRVYDRIIEMCVIMKFKPISFREKSEEIISG